jgi:hypothetical protein
MRLLMRTSWRKTHDLSEEMEAEKDDERNYTSSANSFASARTRARISSVEKRFLQNCRKHLSENIPQMPENTSETYKPTIACTNSSKRPVAWAKNTYNNKNETRRMYRDTVRTQDRFTAVGRDASSDSLAAVKSANNSSLSPQGKHHTSSQCSIERKNWINSTKARTEWLLWMRLRLSPCQTLLLRQLPARRERSCP